MKAVETRRELLTEQRIISAVGDLPAQDIANWEDLLHAFHTDNSVLSRYCSRLSELHVWARGLPPNLPWTGTVLQNPILDHLLMLGVIAEYWHISCVIGLPQLLLWFLQCSSRERLSQTKGNRCK